MANKKRSSTKRTNHGRQRRIRVEPVHRTNIDLRGLARALILLVEAEQAKTTTDTAPTPKASLPAASNRSASQRSTPRSSIPPEEEDEQREAS